MAHILKAAENGHSDILETILKCGGNVEARNHMGATPLMLAAKGGHLMAVSMLLKHKADINVKDQDGRTALSFASEGGYVQICDDLLGLGAEVNLVDNEANSPLHYAAAKGRLQIVKLLFVRGADADRPNENSKTPTILATENNHVETVNYLMPIITKPEAEVTSPLPAPALFPPRENEVLNILPDDKCGDVLPGPYVRSEHANPELRDVSLQRPTKRHEKVNQEDLSEPAVQKPDQATADGDKHRRKSKVPKKPRSPSSPSKKEMFAAGMMGLINAFASLEPVDPNKPLQCDGRKDGEDQVSPHISKIVTIPDAELTRQLHDAIESNDEQKVISLLHQGAQINANDESGNSPLFNAVYYKNPEIVNILLKSGGDVNFRGHDGNTPVHIAAHQKTQEILDALLAVDGVQLDVFNKFGESPRDLLKKAGMKDKRRESMKKIIERGWRQYWGVTANDSEKGLKNDTVKNTENGFSVPAEEIGNVQKEVPGISEEPAKDIIQKTENDVNIQTSREASKKEEGTMETSKKQRPVIFSRSFFRKKVAAYLGVLVLTTAILIGLLYPPWSFKTDDTENRQEMSTDNMDDRLHEAALSDNITLIISLLEQGVGIDSKDENCNTPLHYAVDEQNMAIVNLLLSKGADVNAQGLDDNTPLHIAAFEGSEQILAALLAKGASLEMRNKYGKSPVDLAQEAGHPELLPAMAG